MLKKRKKKQSFSFSISDGWHSMGKQPRFFFVVFFQTNFAWNQFKSVADFQMWMCFALQAGKITLFWGSIVLKRKSFTFKWCIQLEQLHFNQCPQVVLLHAVGAWPIISLAAFLSAHLSCMPVGSVILCFCLGCHGLSLQACWHSSG